MSVIHQARPDNRAGPCPDAFLCRGSFMSVLLHPSATRPPSSAGGAGAKHTLPWLARCPTALLFHRQLPQGHGDGALSVLAHHGDPHALARLQARERIAEGRLTQRGMTTQAHDHVARAQTSPRRGTVGRNTADQHTVLDTQSVL